MLFSDNFLLAKCCQPTTSYKQLANLLDLIFTLRAQNIIEVVIIYKYPLLIKRVKEEFLRNITVNQGIIHKVTRIYCDNVDDRKDLFQEVLIQLWKSYGSFKEQSKFSTWMYRVAINTAITAYKRESRQTANALFVRDIPSIADDDYDYELEENLNFLHTAIDQLTGIEKSIILLYLEDKSYEEIAEITGITQNYVRVKMNRIKKKLESLIKGKI